jgi:hypothetical protein
MVSMNITKITIGNAQEAFVENRFTEGINIISSDDNNKGKTIVIQSIMFALGNDPIFPSSFSYKDYYHIVEFKNEENEPVSICRKGNSFTVLYRKNISVFDNLSEFKHFINKTIFPLPVIIKDGIKKLVDPMLFYQLFFVGQDNKDTSNIILHGYYNKDDFENMLYSYSGVDITNSDVDEDEMKEIIKSLKNEKTELQKQNKILKSAISAIKIASMANDRLKFEKKLSKVEKLKNNISFLSTKRNKVVSRIVKNEITLKELRSLNQSLTAGKLHCLDCQSTNVGYSTADNSYTFDISSSDIRSQIISSIEDKIEAYKEEADQITIDINKHQEQLKSILSEDEVSLESLLMYKSDLMEANEADSKLIEIDNALKKYNNMLTNNENTSKVAKEQKEKLYKSLMENMNGFYKMIDPQGNLYFKELFSKKQSVYSGSEETEFYLSKLYAQLAVFKHKFPIIIDHFRAGELSSVKEEKVLELFGKFKNQVILTVTLKDEELGKYDNNDGINHISFTPHMSCKLLTANYLQEFIDDMKKFSLNVV